MASRLGHAHARPSHFGLSSASTQPAMSDHYREIFEITRLSDFMKVFSDEESAIGEATQGRE
jgi:hypothetical protein